MPGLISQMQSLFGGVCKQLQETHSGCDSLAEIMQRNDHATIRRENANMKELQKSLNSIHIACADVLIVAQLTLRALCVVD